MNNLHNMFILTKYLLKKKLRKWEISLGKLNQCNKNMSGEIKKK